MHTSYNYYPYITINASPLGDFSEAEFFEFCHSNENLSFERDAQGDIILMAPTGNDSGRLESALIAQLWNWNHQSNLGYCFSSNTGFTLPDNSVRSPDASFIYKERYEALPAEDRKRFAHICPDFVIELMSVSDNIRYLKNKMAEYIANGCHLGWLIDPYEQKIWVYTKDGIEERDFSSPLSGGNVLPGFTFDPKTLTEKP